jgi:asparagine synthase (glutamine-hydrolysing)
MCGILFLLDPTNKVTKDDVEKAFGLIKYRGPDNTTILEIKTEYGTMFFGHHRLSIINPESEKDNQPFHIETTDNTYIMLVNGEIYNYKKIFEKYNVDQTNNDCKAILSSYIHGGDCDTVFDELDGDFAYILYDKKMKQVRIARDHIGLKPLYIGVSSNNIIGFCSESKVLESLNLDNNIKQLEPKTSGILELSYIDPSTGYPDEFNFSVRKYNLIYDDHLIPENDKDVTDDINKILTQAVIKRIEHTHRPLAILCSGGVDSSIILAIAATKFPDRQFEAFSIEFDGRGISYDTLHAKIITDCYDNVKHTIVKFTEEEGINAIKDVVKLFETHDPNTLRAGIPMYLLAKHISKHTDYKVILSGEGADELFLGYEHFTKLFGKYTLDDAKKESLRLLSNLYSFDILRAERSFSSNGLELRVPFLDQELVYYINDTDPKYIIPRDRVEKYILRKSFSNIGIPERILFRQKERFSDGIGYGWVPILINYCKDKGGESKYFKSLYDESYKFDTILKREMPKWCNIDETSMLES